MTQYDSKFYDMINRASSQSAKVLVPIVVEYCHPKSVVDVGCGQGTWLAAFATEGTKDIMGIDGEWVEKDKLRIPEEKFACHDLSEQLRIDQEFELAISLEVAEHIPPEKARIFVETLAYLSPVVLFSAAVPYQGGTNHINEQWQSYWAKLFEERGYVPVDCIRKHIWDDARVGPFYAQNTLIYVKKDQLARYPKLKTAYENIPQGGLDIIHPYYLAGVARHFWIAQQRRKLISLVKRPLTFMKRLLSRKGT